MGRFRPFYAVTQSWITTASGHRITGMVPAVIMGAAAAA